MKSGMFRIYLFLKDETGDDYIGKIKFMCSPAEFSSFAGDAMLTKGVGYDPRKMVSDIKRPAAYLQTA